MKKISELNISKIMKLKLVGKEINDSRRKIIQRLKREDPEAYQEYQESLNKNLKRFIKKNPDYNKNYKRKRKGN